MRIHALVLAGGSGDRFGAEMPKQFVRLAGEPILARTVRILAAAGIDRHVEVSHPSWMDDTPELIDGLALTVPASVEYREEVLPDGNVSLEVCTQAGRIVSEWFNTPCSTFPAAKDEYDYFELAETRPRQ